jgi:hypothetical protein|tara:strand:- start:9 stop:128 length:120 start_codon:yes stop_codon:yes gene_type:complete
MIYKPKEKTLEKLRAYLKKKDSINKSINKTKKLKNGNSI